MILVGVLVAACLGYIVWYVWNISSVLEGVTFDDGDGRGPGGLPPEDQAPSDGPGSLEIEVDQIARDLKTSPRHRDMALLSQ